MNQITDHEYQFNPRVAVGDVDPYIRRATAASATARDLFDADLDVRYGAGPLMTCDVFPAEAQDSPVHVFVHGGYWRGRDKADYSFLANTLVGEGITTVVVNYDLCPTVTVDAIVGEVMAFFQWLQNRFAPRHPRVVASGHSAGAHLIAMADIRQRQQGLAGLAIDHAVLISGLYDLRPVLKVSVNETIGLTAPMAEELSPALHGVRTSMPVDVVVGGAESQAWIGQSRDYARQVGALNGCRVLDGHDHYSIMEELMSTDTTLSRLLIDRSLRA